MKCFNSSNRRIFPAKHQQWRANNMRKIYLLKEAEKTKEKNKNGEKWAFFNIQSFYQEEEKEEEK